MLLFGGFWWLDISVYIYIYTTCSNRSLEPFLTHVLRGRNSSRPRGNHLEGYPRPGSCYSQSSIQCTCLAVQKTQKIACLANKRKNNICTVWLSIFNSACLAVQKTWLFNKTACLSLAFIWLCVRTNTFKCKWLYICLYMFVRAQVWVRNQLLINYVDVIIVCDDCCISWLFD